MRYHNITTDDMLNGSGLRVVLWLSGCEHKCKNCHNPETWDLSSGIAFDNDAKLEIFNELNKDYISGITFSGGDPFHKKNRREVLRLIDEIYKEFSKDIWLYTGYEWEDILSWRNEDYFMSIMKIDKLVTGKYEESLNKVNLVRLSKKDSNLEYVGSSNQEIFSPFLRARSEGIVECFINC